MNNINRPQKLFKIGALPIILALAFFVSFYGNGIYTFLCAIVLFFILNNLFYKNVPPVFGFITISYWMQTFFAVILTNLSNVDVDFFEPFTSNAVILSLIGICLMSICFKYAVSKNIVTQNPEELLLLSKSISFSKVLYLYLFGLFLQGFLYQFTQSALSQFVFSLIDIKWLFFVLLVFKVSLEKKNVTILLFIILFEFVSGFFTFFSSFKEVILFFVLALFISINKIKFKNVFFLSIIGSFLFILMVTWTSIKGEYRGFVNNGKANQNFEKSKGDASDKLSILLQNQSTETFEYGMKSLVYRIQYMENFARVLKRIPLNLPYENGALWLSNLEFIFTPRFLNPNKGILDPSVKTNKYTGINYATAAMGVSISLGYFAECYIDFGAFGMFIPLILIALIMMIFYNKIFRTNDKNLLLNYAFVIVTFSPFYAMESDGIFLVGRLFFSITTYLLIKIFLSKIIIRYISI